MNLDDLIRLMSDFFRKFKVDHFTIGAVAMNFWIPPRFTHDLDLIVCIKKGALSRFVSELKKVGLKITKALARKLKEGRLVKFPIGNTELDIRLCRYDHDYEALRRAREFIQEPYVLFVASAEDIVLYKLQYWRRQDQADIERLVVEYEPLDRAYIEKWLGRIQEATGAPVQARWEEVS